MRKNNSSIICEDKFNATSTVKTSEMTQEILYKLAGTLGIKLKIMEYEDIKEDIYLTIIMPYFIDEDNDLLDLEINELSEENSGKIALKCSSRFLDTSISLSGESYMIFISFKVL